MSIRMLIRCLPALLLLGIAATAQADVIRYTLEGVTFEDGGTATGYFDWDTDLPDAVPEYSGSSVNFEISISGGNETDFPPIMITDENSGAMGQGGTIDDKRIFGFGNLDPPVNRLVYLIPDPASGEVGVDLAIPLYISTDNSIEISTQAGFLVRNMTAGSISGVVIAVSPVVAEPIPVDARWALALLVALVGAMGLFNARRSS